MSKLYLCVSTDKYELPLIVADSVAELARKTGKSKYTIYGCLRNARSGHTKVSQYVEVEVAMTRLAREADHDA